MFMENCTYTPTREEWAYLAGIVDSDGCIGTSPPRDRGGNSQVTLLVGQIDRRLPDWLQERFGGTVKVYTRGPNNFNPGATMYRWRVSSRGEMKYLLHGIYPYLVYKKEQAYWAYCLCKTPLLSKETQLKICLKVRALKRKRG